LSRHRSSSFFFLLRPRPPRPTVFPYTTLFRSVPDGGFYVWVKLPEGLDAKSMLPRAVTARVAYVPGTAFYYDGTGSDHIRLSYCYPTPERIREGVRRLAGVVAAELETVRIFGAGGSGPSRTVEFPSPDIA